jgi:hypothetical protein
VRHSDCLEDSSIARYGTSVRWSNCFVRQRSLDVAEALYCFLELFFQAELSPDVRETPCSFTNLMSNLDYFRPKGSAVMLQNPCIYPSRQATGHVFQILECGGLNIKSAKLFAHLNTIASDYQDLLHACQCPDALRMVVPSPKLMAQCCKIRASQFAGSLANCDPDRHAHP